MRRSALQHRADRGNTLVELALILTPFLALCLSVVELALPIFKKSTLVDAVREGCRYGITFQTTYKGNTYASQTAAVKAVVEANSMGYLDASNANLISVTYYDQVTFADVTRTSNANADGNIIKVSVTGYTHNWIDSIGWTYGSRAFQVTGNPLTINASSADRLESLPTGSTRPTP
ncbi:MAG TPA: TadE/TadG family type IV pilus assembly protein [Bryobacteraceae bacterium]|nr:TadE/TadG family type IV pilus assembly protein [Bryobacteraceae bacterium]